MPVSPDSEKTKRSSTEIYCSLQLHQKFTNQASSISPDFLFMLSNITLLSPTSPTKLLPIHQIFSSSCSPCSMLSNITLLSNLTCLLLIRQKENLFMCSEMFKTLARDIWSCKISHKKIDILFIMRYYRSTPATLSISTKLSNSHHASHATNKQTNK